MTGCWADESKKPQLKTQKAEIFFISNQFDLQTRYEMIYAVKWYL
jgi:hypothetical protein